MIANAKNISSRDICSIYLYKAASGLVKDGFSFQIHIGFKIFSGIPTLTSEEWGT